MDSARSSVRAFISCKHSTSGDSEFNQSKNPFLTTARSPLTFQLIIRIRNYNFQVSRQWITLLISIFSDIKLVSINKFGGIYRKMDLLPVRGTALGICIKLSTGPGIKPQGMPETPAIYFYTGFDNVGKHSNLPFQPQTESGIPAGTILEDPSPTPQK